MTRDPARAFPPGELIADELTARDWTRADFAAASGLSPAAVEAIIDHARPLSSSDAESVGMAFGQSGQTWKNAQAAYDAFLTRTRSRVPA